MDEKLLKLSNPNFKVSETRILFKSIDKSIDKVFLKEFVRRILKESFPIKILNKTRLLKSVKVLEDNKN